jgi:hypothetical protein
MLLLISLLFCTFLLFSFNSVDDCKNVPIGLTYNLVPNRASKQGSKQPHARQPDYHSDHSHLTSYMTDKLNLSLSLPVLYLPVSPISLSVPRCILCVSFNRFFVLKSTLSIHILGTHGSLKVRLHEIFFPPKSRPRRGRLEKRRPRRKRPRNRSTWRRRKKRSMPGSGRLAR